MKHFLAIIILVGFQISCDAQKQNKSSIVPGTSIEIVHSDIDKAGAQKMVALAKDLVIIDVRTPEEIANGKMKDALEMDIKSPDFKERLEKLDRNKQYLVYCHAGGRSAAAMATMKEMGFKRVFNLTSGFRTWEEK
jgi:rhodanese-related sulfurtransferase